MIEPDGCHRDYHDLGVHRPGYRPPETGVPVAANLPREGDDEGKTLPL